MSLPGPTAEAIQKAYRRLSGPVAVRSSMAREDGALASSAGQLETALNVQGEAAMLQAVQQCWVSAFRGRVTRYAVEREGLGAGQRVEPTVAVIVQRMVPSVCAGAAFSADPIAGQRKERNRVERLFNRMEQL